MPSYVPASRSMTSLSVRVSYSGSSTPGLAIAVAATEIVTKVVYGMMITIANKVSKAFD